MLKISELYIYPIKSLQGIAVKQARVTPTGFEHDRRWLLVDENNRFITQRECHEMTQLLVSIANEGLVITHKTKGDSFSVPFTTEPRADDCGSISVVIWDDTCTAEYVSNEADEWFSRMLGMKCRLVYMPDTTQRITDQRYAPEGAITSFADGFPYLIIGQASLDDLNTRLETPLPMNRFRPNLVFTGGAPYQEDRMGNFKINLIDFYGVKLCARCVMTTIDQDNAATGKEPLKTLASYRLKNNKIMFGQNLIYSGDGFVSIGDQIELISYNDDERFIVG